MIQNVKMLLEDDEGRRIWPYTDTMGHRTWGIGHNLDESPIAPDVRSLLQQAVDLQYQVDVESIDSQLAAMPWWGDLDSVRQAVLIDMGFNLGYAGLQNFTMFLSFMAQDRFKEAAADLRQTKAYRELPNRYERLAVMLETGQWPPEADAGALSTPVA